MRGGNSASFTKAQFADKTKHPRWKDGRSITSRYHSIYKRNYKLRKKGATGSFNSNEWLSLLELFGNRCLGCRERGLPLEADHVVPLAKHGTNSITNIQPLCRSCNAQKATAIIDFRTV